MSTQLDDRAVRVGRVLSRYVGDGRIPGGVVLLAEPGAVRIVAEGRLGLDVSDAAFGPDTVTRIASITKPITAVAALQLVDEGRMQLHSPITQWLPELEGAKVARTPTSSLDDVVPLQRAITLEDLLTSRAGWGFASDFTLPAVQALFPVQTDGRFPHAYPVAESWLERLAEVPLVAQPGTRWTYDTSLTILGILVERIRGQRLGHVLAEYVFDPIGMTDTRFTLRANDMGRFARLYRVGDGGELVEADARSTWLSAPQLELGNGGLLGTAVDWWKFAQMLLDRGRAANGRVLSEDLARRMLTNQLSDSQMADSTPFLEGQGWGYGGAVDVHRGDPWSVPGRFGWVGGTGTSGHLIPSTGQATVLLTQVCAAEPGLLPIYRDVWTAGAW